MADLLEKLAELLKGLAGNVGSTLGVITWALANVGGVISLVKQIIGLIHSTPQPAQNLEALHAAYAVARTGDASKLHSLHSEMCGGIQCPAGVKSDAERGPE